MGIHYVPGPSTTAVSPSPYSLEKQDDDRPAGRRNVVSSGLGPLLVEDMTVMQDLESYEGKKKWLCVETKVVVRGPQTHWRNYR